MAKVGKYKLLARFIADSAVRNSKLEDIHAGINPQSKKGDFSDVKVVSPYGEIEWTQLSRISDDEMHLLMQEIEKSMLSILLFLHVKHGMRIEIRQNLLDAIDEALFGEYGVSWNIPDKKYKKMLQTYSLKNRN